MTRSGDDLDLEYSFISINSIHACCWHLSGHRLHYLCFCLNITQCLIFPIIKHAQPNLTLSLKIMIYKKKKKNPTIGQRSRCQVSFDTVNGFLGSFLKGLFGTKYMQGGHLFHVYTNLFAFFKDVLHED